MSNDQVNIAKCRCDKVQLEAVGKPILITVCDCSDCREAGRLLGMLPGAIPILDEHGGSPYALFRKDRVRCLQGAECLGEHRLKPDSPTRRVVATCCNTAMFADFTKGHWISIYRDRLNLDGVPTDKRSVSFVLRLVGAWVAMAFRAPRIDYVKGRIDGIEN